jgi:drug/metabolite transporter (DMT)-like permease
MNSSKPLVGIGLMVLSTAFLASKDGLAKTFLDQVGPVQIIWVQYVGNFIAMALISAPRHGWNVIAPRPLGWQLFRGAASAAGVATLYWALTYIPLADATAMFMLAPVVVTMLSPLLLGERIGLHRWIAVGVGFAGVICILRPGFGGDMRGYYIALLAGFLLGFYLIGNRRLAGLAPPLLNVTHNALMGGILLTLLLPLVWQPIPLTAMPKLAGIVVLAIFGQALMISSFNYAAATVVAPFTYAMLVFAAIIGYVAFGAVPDVPTWIGMFLIVGAGLYIAHRERQAASRPR